SRGPARCAELRPCSSSDREHPATDGVKSRGQLPPSNARASSTARKRGSRPKCVRPRGILFDGKSGAIPIRVGLCGMLLRRPSTACTSSTALQGCDRLGSYVADNILHSSEPIHAIRRASSMSPTASLSLEVGQAVELGHQNSPHHDCSYRGAVRCADRLSRG